MRGVLKVFRISLVIEWVCHGLVHFADDRKLVLIQLVVQELGFVGEDGAFG